MIFCHKKLYLFPFCRAGIQTTKRFPSRLHFVCSLTFSLGIFFLAQPSQIIGYLGQISSCAWKKWQCSFKWPTKSCCDAPRSQRRSEHLKSKWIISNLDIFKVKWLLAVLAVEGSLRALSLIMALLFIEADSFFAGGAGDDHELALPLVVQLWEKRPYDELLWQLLQQSARRKRSGRLPTSYSLILPVQVQLSLIQTADRVSTSRRTALSGKAWKNKKKGFPIVG